MRRILILILFIFCSILSYGQDTIKWQCRCSEEQLVTGYIIAEFDPFIGDNDKIYILNTNPFFKKNGMNPILFTKENEELLFAKYSCITTFSGNVIFKFRDYKDQIIFKKNVINIMFL